MKKVLSPLVWLFVAFMVGLGTMPGLVVCSGDDGHVGVERAKGECCDLPGQPARGWGDYLLATASEQTADDSCGSCTDSPLSMTTVLRVVPKVSCEAAAGGLEISQRPHIPIVLGAKPFPESRSVVARATRIPIATTTLLI